MNKNRIIELYVLLAADKATIKERTEFGLLLQDKTSEKTLKKFWDERWEGISASDQDGVVIGNYENIFDHIVNQPQLAARKKRLWPAIAAAASLLLFLSAGVYFVLHNTQAGQIAQNQKNDIAPGHNQATLTLANGKKIILTKGLAGLLAQQGQTKINVSQNNITYNATPKADQFSYNTLSTARGEQSPYPLVLADGTKVWLNAESSITFPTAFNGNSRTVKLSGEAYFEVAHNVKQPFLVQAGKQTIEDIGTQFDVNAYADEPSQNTTLIEGSVKVNGLLIKPGQQTDGQRVNLVNTDIITAWKTGNFHFEGAPIQTVMRQLARWYNIEVRFQGEPTKDVFYADISRNRNISAVIKLLENTNGVHFKVEGRRVTVIE